VEPSAPAASTTTSARTNDDGAPKLRRPAAMSVKGTIQPPPSAGRTVRTDASQNTSAPWATASGR
jgi:hypothetical protein